MPFAVRHISADDLQLMDQLMTVFGHAFEDVATYTGKRPDSAYLHRLLSKDYFIALAAVQDDQVIGGLAAYEMQKFEQQRSEIYIYDLAVDAGYRRLGVATALITQLKQIAAQRSAYVVFVQADLGDDPAIALYSKLGIREDVLHFDINI